MALSIEEKKKLTDAGYSDTQIRAYEVLKSRPAQQPTMGDDIKNAFRGGVEYFKQGQRDASQTNNPIKKTEAGLKMVGGVIQSAFSPLAPVTKYLGEGIDLVADKVSDSPTVQKFAMSDAGKMTTRVAEDVANTSAGLSVLGGGSKGTISPKVPKVSTPKVSTGAGAYVKSTVRDIVPTKQAFINEQTAKGLDLTPGDMANIKKSTGNDAGKWLAENNLIGKNKDETQGLISKKYESDYKAVRTEIDKVLNAYSQKNIPRFADALTQIKKQISDTPGLESDVANVNSLLAKKNITLRDVQTAKELLDEHFSLYKVTGDVAGGVQKEGLANIRNELKTFIENEVLENRGVDISKLNNNVATARSLNDAITKRTPTGLKKSNISTGDFATLGLGWAATGNPLGGIALVFIKKVMETPTVRLRMARMIDKMSDAQKARIRSELERGMIPMEFREFVKQKDLVGRVIRQAIPAVSSERQGKPQK